MACTVRYSGALHAIPQGTTAGSLHAALGAPGPLLVLARAPYGSAWALRRIPGLTLPLVPEDAKTHYLRILDPLADLHAVRVQQPGGQSAAPAALYALPATCELLLLQAREDSPYEGGSGGMGVAVGAAARPAPAAPLFSHDALLRLATLENAARVSPAFQALFSAAERDEYSAHQQASWMELCSELQYALVMLALCHRATAEGGDADLHAFAPPPELLAAAVLHCIAFAPSAPVAAALAAGLAAGAQPGDAPRGVYALRTGGHAHPATIGAVSLYWKYNRVARGALRDGAPAPNAALATLAGGAPTDLHALIAAAHPRPLLVLAGSYS